MALARAGGGFLVIGGFLGGHLASGRPDYRWCAPRHDSGFHRASAHPTVVGCGSRTWRDPAGVRADDGRPGLEPQASPS
ncbi:hypothetical protein ACX80N_08225 [Arthrobacter sp. MDT2-16]